MKKSELYARYYHFNKEIIEVTPEEFYAHFIPENKDKVSHFEDGSTSCYTIRLDGVDYMQFSSHWNVGWQGDVDCDQFFCKKVTVTAAEMEELSKIFSS
jgi:hypothetical protein